MKLFFQILVLSAACLLNMVALKGMEPLNSLEERLCLALLEGGSAMVPTRHDVSQITNDFLRTGSRGDAAIDFYVHYCIKHPEAGRDRPLLKCFLKKIDLDYTQGDLVLDFLKGALRSILREEAGISVDGLELKKKTA